MNKIKEICIITNKYPNKYDDNVLVFVQQLAWQFAQKGVNCTVICPMPININPNYRTLPYQQQEKVYGTATVTVLRPKYIGFGQKNYGKFNPAKLTTNLFSRCVESTIRKTSCKFDVLYSHFITPAGVAAAKVGNKFNIPSFVAHGESTSKTIDHLGGAKVARKMLTPLAGAIAVSGKNKNMLTSMDIVPESKIEIFPNGYDPSRFYKMDKVVAREKMNFPKDEFIVGFVGSYDNRKGILRLNDAVEQLDGVKFACAGKGKLIPTSKHCILKEPVNHEDLVYFYNACDIFVLPTLNEGCCNAIVESIACGIPIISSDLSFNDEILNETNAIRINPNQVDEIAEAIQKLKSNIELRNTLAQGSAEMAKQLTIDKRAENIIKFMESKM